MSRGKYLYFINNKEVDKKDFIKTMEQHYLTCDTNYDNPLLNVSFVDYKKFRSNFNWLKRGANKCSLIAGGNIFHIKKVYPNETKGV